MVTNTATVLKEESKSMKLSLFVFFLVFLLSLLVERHGFGGEDLLLLMSRGQNDVTWYCCFPQGGILGFLMA